MTIDKDHKAQKIRLVGGVYAETGFNWTGEGSFYLRKVESLGSVLDFDPDDKSPPQPVTLKESATDYTIRFITIEGERYTYAAPRAWSDAEAVKQLFTDAPA